MTDIRAKICTLEDLAATAERLRGEGKRIALAHGVFDLLHMGHVRHLEAARQHGDVLMVTITSDRHVNKGPGRPVFPEGIRSEMLAALHYVDWVAINDSTSSEPVINSVRPDAYVKGDDYQDASADRTGKIIDEQNAVEQHGGKIVFTDDIRFSSSSLINRYLDVFDPELQEYLAGHRGAETEKRLVDLLDSIQDLKVLLIGDTIIDEYRYVNVMGKSAKEPIIATHLQDKELFAGGVLAAANHLAGFCNNVDVVTALGTEPGYEEFITSRLAPNISLNAYRREGVPTICKSRFVEVGSLRKLFEVYDFDDSPIGSEIADQLNTRLAETLDQYDVVIAADFGHGFIQRPTIDILQAKARFLAVNTQTNSANLGYNLITKYARADYVCIDAPEAQLATQDRHSDLDTLITRNLRHGIDAERIVVTHGKYGCVTFDRSSGPRRIPAFTRSAVDTVGAGDAFLAITAPLVERGGAMDDVGFIGNAVGALKVGHIGHRQSTDKLQLIRYIGTLLK